MVRDVNSIQMDRSILEISSLIEKMEKESNSIPKGKFCTMETFERISSMEKEKRFGTMEAILKEDSFKTPKRVTDWLF